MDEPTEVTLWTCYSFHRFVVIDENDFSPEPYTCPICGAGIKSGEEHVLMSQKEYEYLEAQS